MNQKVAFTTSSRPLPDFADVSFNVVVRSFFVILVGLALGSILFSGVRYLGNVSFLGNVSANIFVKKALLFKANDAFAKIRNNKIKNSLGEFQN